MVEILPVVLEFLVFGFSSFEEALGANDSTVPLYYRTVPLTIARCRFTIARQYLTIARYRFAIARLSPYYRDGCRLSIAKCRTAIAISIIGGSMRMSEEDLRNNL
jgi:hypothetical protein